MKKFITKIRDHCNYSFILAAAFIATSISSIPVFAAEGDSGISTVTDSVTSAITASKSEFVTAIGAVVAVGVGWFLVKYVVMQVITYFKKVASK